MHTIDLTYVEQGIHEELVAYVADQPTAAPNGGYRTSSLEQ